MSVVPERRPLTTAVARPWISGFWTAPDQDEDFFERERPPEELLRRELIDPREEIRAGIQLLAEQKKEEERARERARLLAERDNEKEENDG